MTTFILCNRISLYRIKEPVGIAMLSLYTFLKEKDLVIRNKTNTSKIRRLSTKKIFDLAEELLELTHKPEKTRETSVFANSASLSLGGGRDKCGALSCRISRLDRLARFVLLYSNKTYINNFFYEYFHYETFSDEQLRHQFYQDISILNLFRPLLEKGYINIFTPFVQAPHICPQCQWHYLCKDFDRDTLKRRDRSYKMLQKEFLDNISVFIGEIKEGYYYHTLEGPDELLEGGSWGLRHRDWEIPNVVSSHPRLMKKLEKERQIKISKTLLKQTDIHKDLASIVDRNAFFAITTSQVLGTSFVTDSELEISYLKSITDDIDWEQRNKIAYKYLTSFVPFLEDVPLKGLLKLREREEESLLEFRNALNKSIDLFRNKKSRFTEKTAKELYSDVIEPRLRSMDKRLKYAKKDLVTKPTRTVIGTVGAITFGVYFGLIPSEMIGLAKALGLTKVVSDLLQQIMNIGDAKQAIRNDELYFLWKLKQDSKKQP